MAALPSVTASTGARSLLRGRSGAENAGHASVPLDTLSPRDFDRIARYIHATAGIKMPRGKATMLEGRLRRRVRANGFDTLESYCAWLFAANHLADESLHLINAVTTNKTDFFREPHHFTYLTDTILPSLPAGGRRRLRVWSAGCSTGAEPYTIAMLLDAFAADHVGIDYGILATDLDSEVLEVARRGVYATDLIAPVPAALRARYVMPACDNSRREVRMAARLRSSIGYARLNLMDTRYPVGNPMDLIFCRNVLIYFDKPTQEAVVRRLVDCLEPGGHLFLGHSENVNLADFPLVSVGNTIFQKV
jgi:chemotaxis protein methyltransferase CheR